MLLMEPMQLQNEAHATPEQLSQFAKCTEDLGNRFIAGMVINGELLIDYCSKSFFVRARYDRFGTLTGKDYYSGRVNGQMVGPLFQRR